MPINEKLIQVYYQPFLEKLKEIIKESSGVEYWKAFILWYTQATYPEEEGNETWITDGHNDGTIDAVVRKKSGGYVVIQSKYNEGYAYKPPTVRTIPPKHFQPFDSIVIPAFKTEESWEEYLKKEKVADEKIQHYQPVFDAYQKNSKSVKFVFITTFDKPSQIQKQFTHLDISDFLDINNMIFLFEEDQDSKTPLADDLELRVMGEDNASNYFVTNDDLLNATSYIARCQVKDLIDYMQGKANPEAIISKNVRVALPNSKINTNLLDSYNNEPENFWYYHNGITILAEKITEVNKTISGTHKEEKWLTIKSPNIINGAQTTMTLKKALKVHDRATILVKIYQFPQSKSSKDRIHNIIISTNRQNAIYYQDLRANEPVMYEIKKHFGSRRVFFERRRGEKNLLGARIKHHRQVVLTPPQLGQIILISKNKSEGVMLSKASKELMFKIDENFQKIFRDTNLMEMYAMFVVRKLIVDEILNDTKLTGKNYLRASISGIFWLAISKMSQSNYKKFIDLSDIDLTRFSYKNYKSDLKDLKTVMRHIIKLADVVTKQLKYPTGKGDKKWAFFVDTKNGNIVNEKLFEMCKNDKGMIGKKRRKFGKSKKSDGIYKDIQIILKKHITRFNPCSNCSKITDSNEEECEHCHKKL